VADRDSHGYPRKKLQISVRLQTTQSANHICGLIHDVLSKRGHQVDTVVIHRSETPLARYVRPGS